MFHQMGRDGTRRERHLPRSTGQDGLEWYETDGMGLEMLQDYLHKSYAVVARRRDGATGRNGIGQDVTVWDEAGRDTVRKTCITVMAVPVGKRDKRNGMGRYVTG